MVGTVIESIKLKVNSKIDHLVSNVQDYLIGLEFDD